MFQPPRTRNLYHVVIDVATGQSSEVLDSIKIYIYIYIYIYARYIYTGCTLKIIDIHRASRTFVWISPAVCSTSQKSDAATTPGVHCRDVRAWGYTTTAMHDASSPPRLSLGKVATPEN